MKHILVFKDEDAASESERLSYTGLKAWTLAFTIPMGAIVQVFLGTAVVVGVSVLLFIVALVFAWRSVRPTVQRGEPKP